VVEHSVRGFLPGTLVGLYDATQEERQAAREPPTAVPIALAVAAESTAVAFADPPTGVTLLAYGSRTDGRAGWISTRASRVAGLEPPASEPSEPDLRPLPPTSEPPRSEPEPEFGRPQPPPTPRKPTWAIGARGADLGRRR
jgi:hypothetical protein